MDYRKNPSEAELSSSQAYSPNGDKGEQAYQIAHRHFIEDQQRMQAYIPSIQNSYRN